MQYLCRLCALHVNSYNIYLKFRSYMKVGFISTNFLLITSYISLSVGLIKTLQSKSLQMYETVYLSCYSVHVCMKSELLDDHIPTDVHVLCLMILLSIPSGLLEHQFGDGVLYNYVKISPSLAAIVLQKILVEKFFTNVVKVVIF